MITDVIFQSLRSRSQLIKIEDIIHGCEGSRMPEIVPDALTVQTAANAAEVCPTQAITIQTSGNDSCALRLDYAKCIGCGRCMDVSGGSIRPAKRLTRTGVSRDQLVRTWQIGKDMQEEAMAADTTIRDRVYALLGRALNIRQLDPGSCNGCETEITALTNPYYDLERFGIHFVASPKHADMLLVTGPITSNMATAVIKTYEAVPAPKLVVAVGACGCSGGIFDPRNCPTGTAARVNEKIIGPVDSLLPVDGYIPGCPPTPAMLLTGILEVLSRSSRRK